jgi:hypothetical protein
VYITRTNYADLATFYGATIAAPKAASQSIQQAITGNFDHQQAADQEKQVTVLPDYNLISANGSYSYKVNNPSAWPSYIPDQLKCIVGGRTALELTDTVGALTFDDQNRGGNLDAVNFSPVITSGFEISVLGTHVSTYSITVICNYILNPAVFAAWQADAYTKLQAAYDAKLTAYNAAMQQQTDQTAVEDAATEQAISNPAFNRLIEQRELKRACIELLLQPFCRKMGVKLFENSPPCNCSPDEAQTFPTVPQNEAFGSYAAQVRFFEQALDWNILSYTLHPYYWAEKCRWAQLMQAKSDDQTFQAFLQSGMSEVVVPVRPEYTEAVAYYMETGIINDGYGKVTNGSQALIAELLRFRADPQPRQIGASWETRVPSTLTIIQSSSAGLKADGLPCCHDPESTFGEFFATQNTLMPLSEIAAIDIKEP